MKRGKYLPLGYYQNLKIGYGTVDYKELKTVYIKFKTWIMPLEDVDCNYTMSRTIKKIKTHIFNLESDLFQRESIVDLNMKVNSVKPNKMSFVDIEITLFTKSQFDIKDKKIKNYINNLINDIIDDDFENKNFYNFHKNKK